LITSPLPESGLVTNASRTLDVNVIICCTGYQITFPYLLLDNYRPKSETTNIDSVNPQNTVSLYELIHPLHRRNLFFIGIVEIASPLAPVSEAQARWSISVLLKKVSLPSPTAMAQAVSSFQAS
jgi:dimethylaniline monooxygenase (N-oxide forming)